MKTPRHPNRAGRADRIGRPGLHGPDWVGGRVAAPFYITEGTPYRPDIILWLELPEGIVVHFEICDESAAPVSFGASLQKAMESPMVGPGRQPGTVRVAEAHLAEEVRQILPDTRVIEAPTPEVHEVIRHMSEAKSGEEGRSKPSYFEDGRVGVDAIEALFGAAKILYRIAPWKNADDSRILRVDIPAYNIEGACLSIIGHLGESIGLILFPSVEGLEQFLLNTEAQNSPGAPLDLGTTTLSLNFVAGSELPASMRKEALKHGWPLADANAYPLVEHRDTDGMPRPLSEQDVRIMTACATSLAAFYISHRSVFEEDSFGPVCESYFDDDDVEVRFTFPYEAAELFDADEPPDRGKPTAPTPRERGIPEGAKIGRNEPCPCGSGKKYKRCCLERDEERECGQYTYEGAGGRRAAVHDLDRKLNMRMFRYAAERFGRNWIDHAAEVFLDEKMSNELLDSWAMHHHLLDGKPLSQWFLEDPGIELSGTERELLIAQRSAWLSVWEVVGTEPGRSLDLVDLLTGETRRVVETTASRTLVSRDAILTRVVDHRGTSVLCGFYQRVLSPRDAAEVVRRARGRLRRRKNVPADRLRDEAIGSYLIACWEDAVEDAVIRAGTPPVLQNTDGDPMLFTVDHFAFGSSDLEEIQCRISSIEGVDGPPESHGSEMIYPFTKKGNSMNRGLENTLIGRVVIAPNGLRVETNSLRRADTMRDLLESALGPLIAHQKREHTDPQSLIREAHQQAGGRHASAPSPERTAGISQSTAGTPQPPLSSTEIDHAILEMKTKHYADWADHPLPSLGGKTPREATETKEGRRMVDTLLKDCENHEARQPAGQRYDFGRIRRDLGL